MRVAIIYRPKTAAPADVLPVLMGAVTEPRTAIETFARIAAQAAA